MERNFGEKAQHLHVDGGVDGLTPPETLGPSAFPLPGQRLSTVRPRSKVPGTGRRWPDSPAP